MMKILGATGLLIEYEDMFPYKAPIEHLSAKNAYSVDEVRDMLKAATCKFRIQCVYLFKICLFCDIIIVL